MDNVRFSHALEDGLLRKDLVISYYTKQGLSQDPSYLSFGQVDSLKPPVWTGKNFYDDFSILTFGM